MPESTNSQMFKLVLDSVSPAEPLLQINSGAPSTTEQLVTISLSSKDTDIAQMKIWGDVDIAHNTNIQTTEDASKFIAYEPSKEVKLSDGHAAKTIYAKLMDDVGNVTAQLSAQISFVAETPVVNITSITAPKQTSDGKYKTGIVEGFDETTVVFTCTSKISHYEVKVVSNSGATHDAGTVIPTTAGSVGTSVDYEEGNEVVAGTQITFKIKGSDLSTAAGQDGEHIIKVFAKDMEGNWSI